MLWGAGCAWEPKVPNAVEHRGTRVHIVAPEGTNVCPDAVHLGDALVAVASRELGLGQGTHRFLVLPNNERDGCTGARDYRQRCVAPPKASVGARATAFNALVRGLLWRSHRGQEVLASAIAKALGDGSTSVGLWDGAWENGAVTSDGELARFAAWIAREHGVDKLVAWYRRTSPGESAAIVEAQFERAVSRPIRQELERFRASASSLESIGPWMIDALCAGRDSLEVGEQTAAQAHDERDEFVLAAPREAHTANGNTLCETSEQQRLVVERFTLREATGMAFGFVKRARIGWRGGLGFAALPARWAVVSCERRRHESGGSSTQGIVPVRLEAGRYAAVLRAAAPNEPVWWGAFRFAPSTQHENDDDGADMTFLPEPNGQRTAIPATPGRPRWLRVDRCDQGRLTIETTPDQWSIATEGDPGTRELLVRGGRSSARTLSLPVRAVGTAAASVIRASACLIVEGERSCLASDDLGEHALSTRGLLSLRARASRERLSLEFEDGCAQLPSPTNNAFGE